MLLDVRLMTQYNFHQFHFFRASGELSRSLCRTCLGDTYVSQPRCLPPIVWRCTNYFLLSVAPSFNTEATCFIAHIMIEWMCAMPDSGAYYLWLLHLPDGVCVVRALFSCVPWRRALWTSGLCPHHDVRSISTDHHGIAWSRMVSRYAHER